DEEGCYMAGSGLTREELKLLEEVFSRIVTEEVGFPVRVRVDTILGSRQELLAFLDNGDELTEEQHDRLFKIYSLEEGMYDSNGRQAYRILLEKAVSRDLLTLDFVHDIEQKLEEEKV